MRSRVLRRRYGRSGGSLQERAAAALKWSLHDVQSMSLQSIRDLVRPIDPELAADISASISSGGYVATPRHRFHRRRR